MTQQTYPKRSFGSAALEAQSDDSGAVVSVRHDDQGGKRGGNGPLFSTRTLVICASLLAGGILCSITATGFSGGGTVVSEADKVEIFGLRQQIQTAKSNAEALPDANAAERSLVRAQTAAGEVAELQNSYLGLAAAIAAAAGKLDAAQTVNQRRDLIPYFERSVAPAVVEPWYLLASDAKVPAGAGLPELFNSGVAWVAQAPETINADGSVPVVWLATQTRTAAGEPRVLLAWAQADYDTTRQVFTNVRINTTVNGAALALEVKR